MIIVEDDDSKKLKLYEDKLKNEIENKNKNMRKVRDHDHLTGEYRGAAHSICNLNYQNPRFIPIVFHNLSGYDAHLFIKEFGNDNKRIKLIPNNEEKYISFSKMMPRKVTRKGKEIVIYTELRFIDSFKFLPSSLNKLTNNLRNDSKLNLRNKFKELSKYFPEEHLDLVTRKLAYPYEYMDCEEKFNETCLPPIEKFYSSLTNKNITKEEYENSQKIWKVFNIQNMREFTSLYNKIDVLLSTDIIENFRDISLKNYKLDPMWYYTTPGFAWDCMLRMTNIKLDLLTDIDQILIFESGIRGGLSQCSQRYSKANNKYMGDKFKKKEESIFLQYLDANNLYGWAMSKYLPTGDFKWVDNVNNFDVMNISDKSCKGYILEVDLSYPKELHDIHSDFPLAPERHFDNKQLPKLLTTLTIFTENLAAVHMKRTQISFKQPIYIGMCVLDLSKMLMYDFYYNIIKKKYGNRVRLLYTDTDSLILEIKTNDFYQDIKINLDHFDTSDYPKDNIYGLPLVNKKVLGKFKDELNGKIMTEFIGLRSKLYSHRILDTEKEIKKAKGVKKNVVENKICFNDFENCLLTKESKYIKQNLFRTKKHDIFTVEQNKKALSVYDDKRFILDNGIDTLAWGHYKTNIDRNDFELRQEWYIYTTNMSGKFNGAHVKLSELTGHRIPFIPCQAHRLNTFLEHSCNASTIIANMVDTLENLYLRNLSKTRWTARAESVKAVWGSLEAIIKSLDEICTGNGHFDKFTRSKALDLQKQLLSFDFIVSIVFIKNIMYKLKCLTETLETKHLCIIDAIALIDSTMKMMTEIKSDDQAINNLIDSALSFATLLGTNPESYFKTHHRRKLCPKRIDPRPSTEVEFTIHLFYRREFKVVLDTLIRLSNSNLKQCISSVQPLFQLFSQPLDKSNITLENITNSLSLFPVDSTGSNLKDLDLVQTQLEILFNMLQDDS
ncbi:hypothetical protein QTP88_028756 [Uroleucon formosanum]